MPVVAICCPVRVPVALLVATLLPIFAAQGQTAVPAKPLIEWHADSNPSANLRQSNTRTDQTIIRAEHTEQLNQWEPVSRPLSAQPAREKRKLAPPSGKGGLESLSKEADGSGLPFASPQVHSLDSLGTAGAGLAIVVGLFLLCMWLFRRSGPKATSPLPKDAVAILGRLPLAGNHFVHLMRLGSKLVLVAVGPDSVTTLAEVNDPNEVQHLLGLCAQNHSQSTTAEFQQVLNQLAQEPARGFLEKNTAAASYARTGKN